MTPTETRNEHLAQTIIKNLQRRHIQGFYCPTAEEAVKKVSELIADGESVTWGGTMTVRDLGIPAALKSRETLEVLDRDLVESPEEKQSCGCHYLGTEEGNLRDRIEQGRQDGGGCPVEGKGYGIADQCCPIRHQDPMSGGRHLP